MTRKPSWPLRMTSHIPMRMLKKKVWITIVALDDREVDQVIKVDNQKLASKMMGCGCGDELLSIKSVKDLSICHMFDTYDFA